MAGRWQSQTQDPRLDRAGNEEGGWARRSWVVMPSLRQWRAAGRSLPFPQRTRPPCYLMRELSVTGRQDCSQDSSREQEINPPARDRGRGGWAGQVINGPCNYCAFNLGQSSQEGDGEAAQSEAPADSGRGYQPCLALFLPFPLLSPLGPIPTSVQPQVIHSFSSLHNCSSHSEGLSHSLDPALPSAPAKDCSPKSLPGPVMSEGIALSSHNTAPLCYSKGTDSERATIGPGSHSRLRTRT